MRFEVQPKQFLKSALFVLVASVFAGLWAMNRFDSSVGILAAMSTLIGSMIVFLGSLVVIGVHELGHFLAVRSLGLDCFAVRIGPFLWKDRRVGRLPTNLERAGGFVIPRFEDWKQTKGQLRRIVVGGPVASLVLAVALIPLLRFPARPESQSDMVSLGVALGGFGLAFVAWLTVLNIVPFMFSGMATDGYQMLVLSKRGPASDRFAIQAYVGSFIVAGRRFKSLPPEVITILDDTSTGDEAEASAKYLVYAYQRDIGKTGAAKSAIERALQLVNGLNCKNEMLVQAIKVEAAFMTDDALLGRSLLLQTSSVVDLVKTWRKRAEAHVLMLEGRTMESQAALREFDRLANEELALAPERLQSARESVEYLRQEM